MSKVKVCPPYTYYWITLMKNSLLKKFAKFIINKNLYIINNKLNVEWQKIIGSVILIFIKSQN